MRIGESSKYLKDDVVEKPNSVAGNNAAINLVGGPIKMQSLRFMNACNPGIIDYCGFMWRLDGDSYIQIVIT